MKTFPLLACLVLCGCDNSSPSPAPAAIAPNEIEIPGEGAGFYISARVVVITNSGHRLAVIRSRGHGDAVGICEVTDASLVKTNAEATK